MKDIAFWPSDAQWPRVATVYTRGAAGLTKTTPDNDTFGKNVYFRGSGGLYSTAEDYIPFGMMLANGGELGGKRLLSRKTVEMLRAAHVLDTLPGRPAGEGYGLGVRVVLNHAARNTLLSDGTYGWTGAQGTHFFVDPEEQLVGVLMVQTSNGEIQRDFEDLVAQSVAD
jgi:CubicO group peptidase (beta-lactamase class C family)